MPVDSVITNIIKTAPTAETETIIIYLPLLFEFVIILGSLVLFPSSSWILLATSKTLSMFIETLKSSSTTIIVHT